MKDNVFKYAHRTMELATHSQYHDFDPSDLKRLSAKDVGGWLETAPMGKKKRALYWDAMKKPIMADCLVGLLVEQMKPRDGSKPRSVLVAVTGKEFSFDKRGAIVAIVTANADDETEAEDPDVNFCPMYMQCGAAGVCWPVARTPDDGSGCPDSDCSGNEDCSGWNNPFPGSVDPIDILMP